MLNVSKGIRVRTMVVIDQEFGSASAGVFGGSKSIRFRDVQFVGDDRNRVRVNG
jgi:hypothetical protein